MSVTLLRSEVSLVGSSDVDPADLRRHLDAAHLLAAGVAPAAPARPRIEAFERRGTPLAPAYCIALGEDTWRRRLANLGAAPAFGGVTGQFYRVTAAIGILGAAALGIAALVGGVPRPVAWAALSAGIVYVLIQPVLGVWSRAALRSDRLERLDVDGSSPLGSVITCHRHVMALAGGFGRVGDATALRAALGRILWEAVALDIAGDDAAVAEVARHCSEAVATLEAVITGHPALESV